MALEHVAEHEPQHGEPGQERGGADGPDLVLRAGGIVGHRPAIAARGSGREAACCWLFCAPPARRVHHLLVLQAPCDRETPIALACQYKGVFHGTGILA